MAHTLQPFPTLSPPQATHHLPALAPSPTIRITQPASPPPAEASESSSSSSTIRGTPSSVQLSVSRPKRIRGQREQIEPLAAPPNAAVTFAVHLPAAPQVQTQVSQSTGPVVIPRQLQHHHEPVVPGKPGTLRLNIDSIKRTLSESHVLPGPTATLPLSAASAAEALIRKKSGEVVKSSLKAHARTQSDVGLSLAVKSAPTTPIERKVVHFDAKLEHIRLFLAAQKPLAVSRDGSPTLDTSDADEFPFPSVDAAPPSPRPERLGLKFVKMPSLPQPFLDRDVYLEDLSLALDARSINGSIQVRNIAFAKWIAVRFTLDWWQTTSEVTARHVESIRGGSFDRFVFTIKLGESTAKITEKVLFLAIRYTVAGRDIWDNNAGENYQVRFELKKQQPAPAPVPAAKPAAPTPAMGAAAAVTSEAQVADLRRELEKVANPDKQANTRAWTRHQNANLFSAHRYSSFPAPSSSPPTKLTPDLSSLKQRYDFGASLRSAWSPPDLRTPPHRQTASYPMGSGVPFPSVGERTFSVRASASGGGGISPGRGSGSPRDAEEQLPRFTLDPERDYRQPPANADAQAPGAKSGSPQTAAAGKAGAGRPRNHQRSYFDAWAAQHLPPTVKKTPASGATVAPAATTATSTVAEPTTTVPALELSSDSETDTTTDDEDDEIIVQRTPRIGAVQPATPTSPPSTALAVGGGAAAAAPAKDAAEEVVGGGLARSPSRMALLSPPTWSGASMGLSPSSESSIASTPSATSASSPSQSPSSPDAESPTLPFASSPMYDDGSMLAFQGDRDSTHYNFFLNRFCFFTGSPGTPEGYSNSISQRRTQSAPGVDFARTPRLGAAQRTSPSPPGSNTDSPERSPNHVEMNHYGFPAKASPTSPSGVAPPLSGGATPTEVAGSTTPPTADTVTPRPETPASPAAGIAFPSISSVSVAG